jgi:hypothetical protein
MASMNVQFLNATEQTEENHNNLCQYSLKVVEMQKGNLQDNV